MTQTTSAPTEPNFRQLTPGQWIFTGCINASGFPTLQAAQQAHTITRQLRELPRDEHHKLSRADAKLAKTLGAQLQALQG